MIRHEIEPKFPGPLANTLPIICNCFFVFLENVQGTHRVCGKVKTIIPGNVVLVKYIYMRVSVWKREIAGVSDICEQIR